MASKPRVPFALHPALRLRANHELERGVTVALSPDGARALALRGEWTDRCVEVIALADGAVESAFHPAQGCALEGVAWSRDGRRWAAAGQRFEGQTRVGEVFLSGRDGAPPAGSSRVSRYGAISRNAQARPATLLVFAPDGASVALCVSAVDERSAIAHIATDDGAVRERWLPADTCDLYAVAFGDDGALYTTTGDAGDAGGTARYAPDADAPSERWPWPAGCALVPGRRGPWVLGNPRYAWRVAPGGPSPIARAGDARRARLGALRARAKGRWDESYLDDLIAREEEGSSRLSYQFNRGGFSVCDAPERVEGARGFEHEMFWETSFADRFGDDDAVVSDGVAVSLWRDDGAAVTRTLLADDAQRSTHRGARIVGVSTAGDTLALLWKKDARGAVAVLSLFEVDRAAL